MLVRQKKLLFSKLIIAIFFCIYYFGYVPHKNILEPRIMHTILFDICFPSTDDLTYVQKLKRLFYRQFIWLKIKNDPKIIKMTEGFLSENKTINPEAFWNMIQSKGSNKGLEKELRRLRQTWLHIIYSTPLAYELAGIEMPKEVPICDAKLELPPSKIRVVGPEIVHEDGEIDYIIIGSGPAGSVIAHQLTLHLTNVRVVLIDSGPFVKPRSTITEFSSKLMESSNERISDTGSLMIRNGATVGGGTTVNLDLAFSMQLPEIKRKIKSWIQNGQLKASFIHDHANDWQKMIEAEKWVEKHVGTRKVEEGEINENNRILMNGHPFAKTYELNERLPTGQKGEVLKVSATEAFIVPALCGGKAFQGNLSLLSNVKVERIIFEQNGKNKRAEGIVVKFRPFASDQSIMQASNHLNLDGAKKYRLKAKNIIVCAGSLGSAEVLIRSKLDNPNLGKGVVMHPSMGILGLFHQEINVHKGLSASVYAPGINGSYFFESMAADPAFIAVIHPGKGQDIINTLKFYKHLGGFGIMLIDQPQRSNFVYVDDQKSEVHVHYEFAKSDKEQLRDALKEAAAILFHQGAYGVFIPTAEDIYATSEFKPFSTIQEANVAIDKLRFTSALNFISSAHMQGSNKLGKIPSTSVVSLNFRVWDFGGKKEIPNLYVCDSSVFPTSVGANPMQATYTFAKLFVDQHIAEQRSSFAGGCAFRP